MRGPGRLPEDDFYCWRFQVWYNTLDCAMRTRYRTAPGCRDCAQGDHNLSLRRRDLEEGRPLRWVAGFAEAGGPGPGVSDPIDERALRGVPLLRVV